MGEQCNPWNIVEPKQCHSIIIKLKFKNLTCKEICSKKKKTIYIYILDLRGFVINGIFIQHISLLIYVANYSLGIIYIRIWI